MGELSGQTNHALAELHRYVPIISLSSPSVSPSNSKMSARISSGVRSGVGL